MKQISTMFLFLVILTISMQAHAKPLTRYDESTKTCRVLSEGPLEWESQPWGEGGKAFKATCRSCHYPNNEKAPFLYTESKNRDAWDRVFATRYPKCAQDGSWKGISEDQLQMIHDYLWRWADNVVENLCRG